MTGDAAVERFADRLDAWSRHEDADFVRKLKPSLVRRRLRESPPDDGDRDGNGDLRARLETERAEARRLFAQMRPQEVAGRLPRLHLHRPDLHRPDLHRPDLHRPGPLLVLGAAFALGVALARLAAARAHAHPR